MPVGWDERYAEASAAIVPWIERVRPLAGASVLDVRCGSGAVTAAVAARARQVTAFDTETSTIAATQRRLASAGVQNVEFVAGDSSIIERHARDRAGEVDVALFSSALQYMTVVERLRALDLAHEVLAPDGVIVVSETPNRLLAWDYHASGLPFFDALPDDLAVRYAGRSDRAEFRNEMTHALEAGDSTARERLLRWGRGVSFHEFELAFTDFPQSIVACNYEPELLAVRHVHREELALARLLRRVRPEVPPAFSRYWLDLILAPDGGHPRRYIEPWAFETTMSRHVDLTEWDTLLLRGPHARLTASFGGPVDRIVVGIADPAAPLELRIRSPEGAQVKRRAGEPGATSPEYVTVTLNEKPSTITIDASEACHVTFLGFARAP